LIFKGIWRSQREGSKGDFEQTLIHSILKSEPETISKFRKDLPAGLENIIAKTLSKNLSSRYAGIRPH